ncbi:hypothetical protein BJ912DRAFT_1118433 [Pholiota molesta]|nr:hypothetical protein BJ912DRAFT_1118433 [Pholiota molesta]
MIDAGYGPAPAPQVKRLHAVEAAILAASLYMQTVSRGGRSWQWMSTAQWMASSWPHRLISSSPRCFVSSSPRRLVSSSYCRDSSPCRHVVSVCTRAIGDRALSGRLGVCGAFLSIGVGGIWGRSSDGVGVIGDHTAANGSTGGSTTRGSPCLHLNFHSTPPTPLQPPPITPMKGAVTLASSASSPRHSILALSGGIHGEGWEDLDGGWKTRSTFDERRFVLISISGGVQILGAHSRRWH